MAGTQGSVDARQARQQLNARSSPVSCAANTLLVCSFKSVSQVAQAGLEHLSHLSATFRLLKEESLAASPAALYLVQLSEDNGSVRRLLGWLVLH